MIYFIGAGPGDPELVTVKGKRMIDSADVIIYAGSLVNVHVLDGRKSDARVYNSAYMTLEEVVDIMETAWKKRAACCSGAYGRSVCFRGNQGADGCT